MRVSWMVPLLALAVSAPAMAQDTPSAEIGLGYSYLHDSDIHESFPLGWYADIAGNVNHWLGLVAEVGGNYKTVDSGIGDNTFDIKLSVHTAMGGLRLSHRGDGANFYGQLLAGAARATVTFQGDSESVTNFALQPGVGVEVGTGGSVGLRIGGDYRRVFSEGHGVNQWRATAAAVFRIGQK